jgi:hypothetical protein
MSGEQFTFKAEINELMNMIIHNDGHTNVISSDGLRDSKDLIKRSGNDGFTYNRFNFIITSSPHITVKYDWI